MSNSKISGLTAATVPLDGTEVLPIVQSGATKKVENNALRPQQIQSNATSGVLQVVGPAAAATRVMTTPDANFTAARTDTGQTFTGTQVFAGAVYQSMFTGVVTTSTTVATLTTTAAAQWLAVAHDVNGAGAIWNMSIVTSDGSGNHYISTISSAGDYSATGFTISGNSLQLTSDGGGSNARVSVLQLR